MSLRWTESCARLGDNDADLKFEASYQLIAPETEAPKPETPPPPPSLQELDQLLLPTKPPSSPGVAPSPAFEELPISKTVDAGITPHQRKPLAPLNNTPSKKRKRKRTYVVLDTEDESEDVDEEKEKEKENAPSGHGLPMRKTRRRYMVLDTEDEDEDEQT
ncbi:hypothetical protein G7Y79_00002g006300 [Physcia stellaris]|nr:hypothetical protein G7Y79_00002g006300 [Physcia stellaris]